MPYTVGELARLTGVTVRALHHYDAIGLVRPSQRNAAGHRLYDDRDALRLQQVLLFRELGLPLDEIAAAIDEAPSREELLRRHRDALLVQRGRLDAMLDAVEAALITIEKGTPMQPEDFKQLFDGFDPAAYADEAEARWGDTDAYKESARRTKGYRKADWEQLGREAAEINARIVACMTAGAPPTDPALQAAVEAHRLHIEKWFYPCAKPMHKQLGAMYVADPRFTRNLDKVAPGFAQYLAEAIAAS